MSPDEAFHLDMRYFNYLSGLTMTTRRFDELFGGPPRAPEGPWSSATRTSPRACSGSPRT